MKMVIIHMLVGSYRLFDESFDYFDGDDKYRFRLSKVSLKDLLFKITHFEKMIFDYRLFQVMN